MGNYRQFNDTAELVGQLVKGHALYQGPMDWRPYTIKVKRFICDCEDLSRCKLTFWTAETKTLTINFIDHFERFKTLEAL